MKVTNIFDMYANAGAELTVVRLLKIMESRSVIGSILVLEPKASGVSKQEIEMNRISCLNQGFRSLTSCIYPFGFNFRTLLDAIKMQTPNLIHAHLPHSQVLALHLSRRLRIPYVITNHAGSGIGHPHSGIKDHVFSYLLRKSYHNADAVICVSKSSEEALLRDCPGLTNTYVVYNSVGDEYWERQQESTPQYDILMCGRLEAEKNFSIALKAIKELRNEIADLKVVIAGDGSLKNELYGECVDNSLNDVVNFVGWKSSDDVQKLMQSSKVLLLPSRVEGFSLVFLESLASGMPSVVSNIPVFRELGSNIEGVRLVEASDYKMMAIMLKEALSDGKRFERVELRGKFTRESHADNIVRVFDRVLQRRKQVSQGG